MHLGFVNVARYLRCVVKKKGKHVTTTLFSRKYLLVTNVGISATLSAVGDGLEQKYEMLTEDLDAWDPIRMRNMSIAGVTIGVLCHYWYNILDSKFPGRTIKIVMKKVVVDQLICSPLTITTFFLTLAILEKSSYEEFIDEVKKKAWRLYAAEWVIWPPAQWINFYILPTKYRVLYDNTISLGYDMYTSHVKHIDKTSK